MVRKDQMSAVGDDEVLLHRDPAPHEALDLLLERPRVDHHPVAHDAQDPGMQDPGGDQVEHQALASEDDGVARVVAAVVARDDLDARGQVVDDLPLPLVTPLRARNDDVRHVAAKRSRGWRDYFWNSAVRAATTSEADSGSKV